MSDDFTADLKTAHDDLTRSREGMLEAVQALSDPDLDRVRRGGWPVRKVLEHVIHSEHMYARLLAHMRGQSGEGEMPPSERSSAADALEKLGSSRQELMTALEGVDEESFYKLQTVGHEEYSVLSALENVALHDREHSAQVREILERTYLYSESISRYYGQSDLSANILAALQRAGKDLNALTRNDLAPFEEFHLRGRAATMELASAAGLREGMVVLDVGSGIGGPARTLAAEFGCRVTGLDLTEEYCRAAEMLTGYVGLSDKVTFRHGNALDMPFDDGTFDLVWMQHTAMNIEDKERLFGEIRRVLRPGGSLALYEIFAGSAAPLHFPVPWANDPSISFLVAPPEARRLLAAAGFRELVWTGVTGESIDLLRQLGAGAQGAPAPLGLHLVVGDFAEKLANVVRNLEEERIAVVQGIFERAE